MDIEISHAPTPRATPSKPPNSIVACTWQWQKKPLMEIPPHASVTPERTAGVLSRLTFSWISPLIRKGHARTLTKDDVWLIHNDRRVDLLREAMQQSLRIRVGRGSRNPLLLAVYDAVVKHFWIGGASQLLNSILQSMSPFLLRYLLDYASVAYSAQQDGTRSPNIAIGIGYVFGIVAIQIVQSFAFAHFLYRSQLMGSLVRGMLISACFEKAMKLSGRARCGVFDKSGVAKTPALVEGWTNGRIMSLISADISRIDQACGTFHYTWTSVFAAILTVGLLLYNLGVSALSGVAFLVLGLAFVTNIAKRLSGLRSSVNKITDQRLSITSEILHSIRAVKLFTLENVMATKLEVLRKEETSSLFFLHAMKSSVGALSMSLPIFANMLAFITYSLTGHQFEPQIVFSSLALLNSLRNPLNWLPIAIGQAIDGMAALRRIESLLMAEECIDCPLSGVGADEVASAIVLEKACFTWEQAPTCELKKTANDNPKEKRVPRLPFRRMTTTDEKGATDVLERTSSSEHASSRRDSDAILETFKLRDITLNIGRGELVAIVGPVGAGKSSIINAITGNMRRESGQLSLASSCALSPQVPWIQNATIRENITFGTAFDETRYWNVIEACALRSDLDSLTHSDLTEVGERGVTLSGGQKQRINLARSIYSGAGIILMDDPLSALDSDVGKHVFHEAVLGLLRGTCRILVTHQLHILPQCDKIIVIQDGRIAYTGTHAQLVLENEDFRRLLESSEAYEHKEKSRSKLADISKSIEFSSQTKTATAQAAITSKEGASWAVYASWLRSSGSLANGAFVLFLCTLFRIANILTSLWLSWWTADQFGLTRGQYIGIYVALAVTQGGLLFLFFMYTCLMAIHASKSLSNEAMWTVLRAPMWFFDTTPLGGIIHRFSKDVDVMENNLIDALRNYVVVLSMIIGTFVLVIAYFYYFSIAVFVLFAIFLLTAAFYRSSARQLKRIQTTLDGVVFARFNEALGGIACIRAYQAETRFGDRLKNALDDMNGAYFLTFANQRWLSVRMDAIGNAMVFVVGILVVTNRLGVDPSVSGVILSYSLSLVQILQITVRYFSDVDNSMSSAERVYEYTSGVPQEAELRNGTVDPSWPRHGQISFQNARMSYRPELPPVLNGIALSIHPSEHVAIVGRTGAGKSSLLSALLRITPLTEGTISIDGVDISTVGLHDLRSRLAIIPQDPILFRGTVRSNLDPLNERTDLQLWHALRSCRLSRHETMIGHHHDEKNSAEQPPKGLHLDDLVEQEGSNFSLGQRQLLCLARALVSDARVVLIDEGTSALDAATDEVIQETMAEVFKGRTVISIAHRLRTVLEFDRICVMDAGHVVELGTPRELWEQGGIFRSLCESSRISESDLCNRPS